MNPNIDLSQLAIRRDRVETVTPGRRRPWLTRYVFPGLILAGFLLVMGWGARESFLQARPVMVVPVLTTRAEIQQAGTPLFQAAGWVEPRPTPVLITALTEGVVDKLLVVEGQEVKAGQPVALLIREDAALGLNAAEADLRLKDAEAEALLAKVETELKFLPFQIQSAEAKQKLAKQEWEVKQAARGSVPALAISKAESELATTTASFEELKRRQRLLEREVKSLRRLREEFRDKSTSPPGKKLEEEFPELTETEAGMRTALARARQAQVAVDAARLKLDRLTVKAPNAGRVLALMARPGMRLMGMAPITMQDASTVVSLYDPALLQIRADVRLEDVLRVQPGQPARIDTPAVGHPLEGEVLFATSSADIQKNTLQVKVAIKDPPATLKPDMLVQVTFLAPPSTTPPSGGTPPLRLLVPRSLVDSGEGKEMGGMGPHVWLADQAGGIARCRPIKLGTALQGELIEVLEGLTPADKLIAGGREGLRDGDRIKVTGEDPTLGTSATGEIKKRGPLPRLPGEDSGHIRN